jgi:membrane-bound serine protease (ClpP class)
MHDIMRRTVPTLVLLFLTLVCPDAFAADAFAADAFAADAFAADAFAADAPASRVHLLRLSATINPVTADFVVSGLVAANDQGAAAFLLELDTPGGLDTSMREIVQAILASQVPVIVYVAPAGARAASAGAIIVLAADLAAMAPGTNLGAAHPVSVGIGGALKGEDATMAAKVTNDAAAYARSLAEQRGRNGDWAEKIVRESLSTAASEAQRLNVVEILADDRQQLLTLAAGRSYLRNGSRLQLQLDGAEVVETRMDLRRQILNTISHPNVAYLLLMLGILGIFFEISQPGVVLPGAIGAIALLLAFLAFQTLPVN